MMRDPGPHESSDQGFTTPTARHYVIMVEAFEDIISIYAKHYDWPYR